MQKKNIIVKKNASDQALGLCLNLPNAEEQLHPIAYQLKLLTSYNF